MHFYFGNDSSTFLKDTLAAFPKDQYPEHKTVVVSVSSLLAVQPFSNWGLYAAGKAARDRFLGVIALEEVTYKPLIQRVHSLLYSQRYRTNLYPPFTPIDEIM